MNNYNKRLFVLLMVSALVLFFFIISIIWSALISNNYIIKILLWFILGLLFSLSIIFLLGIFLLVHKIHYGKTIGSFNPLIKSSIKFLYPIIMAMCSIIKIDKDKVKGSFIEINNELLLNNLKNKFAPDEVLVLLPHCIQNAPCSHKITTDVSNCKKCGNCQVGDIIDLTQKYNVKLAIATGGTVARKLIKEMKPKSVVAVACERDLSSGIIDTDPLPVIGILNLRPFGPCYNTGVDLNRLEEGLKFLLKEVE
ncbi:DUF116 domain-containing protein [Anaerobranca gottschalkii]|uniref:DUF116 domain-containing protein n=1 Tax=Anaerobranca gottschalkii DSM 13577 TaxID=1120990 RepID=A0A1H9YXK0_9FIRM|nr:DUF116 domain-containing protein [Anaerobranca gottschalkii]SES73835.1 hypothetical protein SAMN03080614_100578 [Anaerobranca gottschalkii DSM 13577]